MNSNTSPIILPVNRLKRLLMWLALILFKCGVVDILSCFFASHFALSPSCRWFCVYSLMLIFIFRGPSWTSRRTLFSWRASIISSTLLHVLIDFSPLNILISSWHLSDNFIMILNSSWSSILINSGLTGSSYVWIESNWYLLGHFFISIVK